VLPEVFLQSLADQVLEGDTHLHREDFYPAVEVRRDTDG
jgi:hypothetical protein